MPTKRLSYAKLAGLPLVLALALAGCSNNTVAEAPVETPVVVEPEVTVEPEPEPVVTPEPDPYAARWPLTGVGTDEVVERPALLVKVENSNLVRGTQRGLQEADILYEVVVEGGITRYIAVYNSQLPEEILPVRSARETDVPIVTPYGGLFAFSGAQQPFVAALRNAGNQLLEEGVSGMSRFPGLSAPHNVVVDPEVLLGQANSSRITPPNNTMDFAMDAVDSSAGLFGTPVETVDVRMSNIQRSVFKWDAENGMFMRYDGDNPSVQANGEQIGATNLILIEATYQPSSLAGVSGDVPTAILTGSGDAVFAANGQYIEGTWQKAGAADPFTFLDSEGQPVVFAPGNTFVQVVPAMAGSWTLS